MADVSRQARRANSETEMAPAALFAASVNNQQPGAVPSDGADEAAQHARNVSTSYTPGATARTLKERQNAHLWQNYGQRHTDGIDMARLDSIGTAHEEGQGVPEAWQSRARAQRVAAFDRECATSPGQASNPVDLKKLLSRDERVVALLPCVGFVGYPDARHPRFTSGQCWLALTARTGTGGRSLYFVQEHERREIEVREAYSSQHAFARCMPCLFSRRSTEVEVREYSSSRDNTSSFAVMDVEQQLLDACMEVVTHTDMVSMSGEMIWRQSCCDVCGSNCTLDQLCGLCERLRQCLSSCTCCPGSAAARSYFKVRASAELTLDDVMDSKVMVPDGPVQLPTTQRRRMYYGVRMQYADATKRSGAAPSTAGNLGTTHAECVAIVNPSAGKAAVARFVRQATFFDATQQHLSARVLHAQRLRARLKEPSAAGGSIFARPNLANVSFPCLGVVRRLFSGPK